MPDYERIRRLGEGNFGEVWLVYDRALNIQRAVKFIPSSRIHDPTNFYNEPHTLMQLRHDNIVRVEDAGRLANGTLYIAMEYLNKGSIDSIYRGQPVPLSKAFRIVIDICWALEYAHNLNFIHRDIKPANILIAPDGRAKLSDFGLATKVPRGAVASPYGYLTHLAPEILRSNRTSKLTDIYALGVTSYRLINGDGFLPEVNDFADIQDLILSGQYPDRKHYRPYVPTRIQKTINRCMAFNPQDRYQSPCEFRRALEAIRICCDWRFRRVRRNIIYCTAIGQNHYCVTITQDKRKKFAIETTKQVGGRAARKISQDCEVGMTLGQMKKRIRRILPRYVLRGK
jgi:serine/threonine-protein kinase